MQTAIVAPQADSGAENKQYRQPPKEQKQTQLWLGLYFPNIAFSASRNEGGESKLPEVIIDANQQQPRIYRANAAAMAVGLEINMALNAAYVLCADLKVTHRDRFAERDQLKLYIGGLEQFSPKIVLRATDIILLEVRHSLRMFGGFKALLVQLRQLMSGIDVCIACAPLAPVAELMAGNQMHKMIAKRAQLQSALGAIELFRTAVPAKLVLRLKRCGLHCLRDLWRLPRADLARRFGPDLLAYLDSLSGQSESPQSYFEAAHYFRAGLDFEQETHASEFLMYAAERLLRRAQSYLQHRALLSEEIHFRFVYTAHRGEPREGLKLAVHAREGGDSVTDFLPQLAEQLQYIQLRNPLIRLELQIDRFKLRRDSTRDLFSSCRQSTESWAMLLDLLMARLGRACVYYLGIRADHRPELAWQKKSTGQCVKVTFQGQIQALRPAWLLSEPLQITVRTYTCLSGAERIEAGWWQGADIRREYYQALSPSGQYCWLYRDLGQPGRQWFLHGLFA